jgi:hypothetical protein
MTTEIIAHLCGLEVSGLGQYLVENATILKDYEPSEKNPPYLKPYHEKYIVIPSMSAIDSLLPVIQADDMLLKIEKNYSAALPSLVFDHMGQLVPITQAPNLSWDTLVAPYAYALGLYTASAD